jgi:hypothetical protein
LEDFPASRLAAGVRCRVTPNLTELADAISWLPPISKSERNAGVSRHGREFFGMRHSRQ